MYSHVFNFKISCDFNDLYLLGSEGSLPGGPTGSPPGGLTGSPPVGLTGSPPNRLIGSPPGGQTGLPKIGNQLSVINDNVLDSYFYNKTEKTNTGYL